MNVPNIITLFRFLIVPVFGYYLYVGRYYEAVAFFILSGLTDVLDGYFARKMNMITHFGEFADPLADKLIQVTAISILCINKVIPFVVIVIVLIKELILAWGAIVLYKKGDIVVPANWYGKLATVILYVAILFAIILRLSDLKIEHIEWIVNILFISGIISTLYALLMYYLNFKRLQREIK